MMVISSLLMMTFMMILSYLKRMVIHLSTVLLRQLILEQINYERDESSAHHRENIFSDVSIGVR